MEDKGVVNYLYLRYF